MSAHAKVRDQISNNKPGMAKYACDLVEDLV
jgi:hypothetical protein